MSTLLDAARSLVALRTSGGTEYHGPCPACGTGDDRFWINTRGGLRDTGRYACRRCGTAGNAVDFLTRFLGRSETRARVDLGLDALEDWSRRPEVLGREVRRFPYVTPDGTRTHDIVRFEVALDHPLAGTKGGKTYRPCEPGTPYRKGGRRPEVPHHLYRAPAVVEAVACGEAVFVSEGEPAAEAIASLGLCGTSGEGGAEKWRGAYSDALRGADVVVLPDSDEPGERHAALVARELVGVAARVRVLRLPGLPASGDAVEYVAAGGTAEEVVRLLEACEPIPPPLTPLHDPAERIVNGHRESRPHGSMAAVHDSHLPRDHEGVNATATETAVIGKGADALARVTPLWGFEKPEPLRWVVRHFIPDGFASVLAADGGIGKSFLALYLGVCVALGRPFFGLPTERRRVLYVDYELDESVHKHRLHRVLAGMGLTPDEPDLERHFYYLRPERVLPAGADDIACVVEALGVGLVVLDSLTLASAGDVAAAQDTTALMRALRGWGTVLALDHISGAAARGNAAEARPFGSVFKRNLARATFTLAKAEGGGFVLRPDKNNFAAPQDLVCFAHEFDGDEGAVTFRGLGLADDEMAGAYAHFKAREVTCLAVAEVFASAERVGCTIGDPVRPTEVVAWMEAHDLDGRSEGTVRNHFTALRREGKIELHDGGRGAIPIQLPTHGPN